MKTTKTFKVEMLAFISHGMEREKFREVEVPSALIKKNDNRNLENIYKFGQNEFQPKQCRSVSVGDVIHYKGRKFMVNDTGFLELGPTAYMCIVGGLKQLAKKTYG